MKTNRVRTRFAPSPTGYLHIGGARTALYDYFWSQSQQGDFILRIEDTDQARFVEGAVEDIIDGLTWLGIEIDEGPDQGGDFGPYVQHERKTIYENHVQQLIEKDLAYYCYCTPERLDAMRKGQEKEKGQGGYDRRCRNLSEDERKKLAEENPNPVIRFKIPLDGETVFMDEIRGAIQFPNDTMDDFVILKRDGLPTYHLASVVDDHLMEISHVMRGEEWIPSAGKHQLLYKAFGWDPPHFVHLPVILSPKGGKLSKRDGATFLSEFRQKGYLAEAMVNFLIFLGWGFDDKTEIMSIDELKEKFEISKIRKASPTFYFEKLDHLNGVYIRSKTPSELADLCRPFMVQAGLLSESPSDQEEQHYQSMIPLIQERMKRLTDAPEQLRFLFIDEITYDSAEILIPKKTTRELTIEILQHVITMLKEVESFDEKCLENGLRKLIEERQLKVNQLFMPIRVGITGSTVSPGLFETLTVLGKERSIKRLEKAVTFLQQTH
jgi:glutamyl-tRNA synthetase